MKTLQSFLLIIGSVAMALMGTSCTSDMYGSGPASQRGSVTGGLTGAALGAIVGNQSGRPLEGAAIGGIIGAAAGSTLGNAQDQENGYVTPTRYYRPSPPVIRPAHHYHTYIPRPPRRYFAPVRPRSLHFHYRN
jgi:phage tail tape-measure protein